MNKQAKELLLYFTVIITGLVLFFFAIIHAEKFLIPFTLSILLAMILMPIEKKLTNWGLSRGWSVFLSDLLLLGFCIGLVFVIGTQIQNITEDWPEYKERLQPKIEKAENYIKEKTGISKQKQEKQVQNALKPGKKGQTSQAIASAVPKVISGAGNFLLVFIYVFFFLYYRKKFKNSVLNFVPKENRENASKILKNFSKVSQQYLFGRFLLIIFLSVIYSVGLTIVGIKHAILVSLIAAILSLVPYIGNVIGIFLAIAMSLLTNGTLAAIIGVLIVFFIAQFIESYILEPYVVGHKVELNPALTLIGVIIGGFVWGIVGMIIAIPVMGILKVIFDSIPVLNPLGYVLDEKDTSSGGGWFSKIKNKVVSKYSK